MEDGAFEPDLAADSAVDLLLATKLYVPRPAATLVRRPRLLERLGRGLRGPLTLLAAPAGWGKTTLLGEWWAEVDSQVAAHAWISLDQRDNDPARFWTYVVAALQTAHPTVGDAARSLLRSPRAPPLEAILTTVLNELASVSRDTALVLDDYHAIENPTIHGSLAFFLDHLPPRLHLVIATRADPPLPLARWRARGAMVELRADDLRFTPDEAGAFLGQVFGLALDAPTIAALEARTEGWIAGLQLAALALRDRADAAGFVGAFRGSHRFVADYLAEEVFQRQAPAVQEFLLRTSILDRFCAPLCQALDDDPADSPPSLPPALKPGEGAEGMPDARGAQRQLEQLDRANLFLIPLDGERRWYRYHHLFADLLRARLQQERPDLVGTLHRRASAWFERASLVGEAIQHALAAEDFARAADLLEPAADPLWMGGQMATLRGWLANLPADVLRARPRLLIAQAGALFFLESHQIGAIEAILREAEATLGVGDPTRPEVAALTSAERDRLLGRIIAIRASQASWERDTGRTIALAREALDRLGSDDPIWRAVALTAVGMAHALRGEMVEANAALSAATEVSLATGASYEALGARFWLAIVRVAQGKLREASTFYHQALDQVTQRGAEHLPVAANIFVGLGVWVEYEWNDLEAAERHLVEGIRLAGRQQWPWVLVDAYATLARIKRTRGEGDAAAELLRRMEQHAREVEIPWPWMAPRVAASMAQACLAFGQVDPAAEWATRFDLGAADDLAWIVEFERLTTARLLLAEEQPARALAELDALAPAAEAHGRFGRVIEIQVLRAVALEGLGKREEALVALGRALALAEPEGYVRRFVDEGPTMRALLAAALARGIAPRYVATLLRAYDEGDWGQGTENGEDEGTLTLALSRSTGEGTGPDTPLSRAAGEGPGVRGLSSPPSPAPRYLTPPLAPPAGENPPPSPLVEPLSDRERDVLRLLVAGRSGPEIADALVVAPSTVKTHLKSIYGKLDVHSRDQAIARVRELRLM